jgi:hypothetical protein
MLHVSRIAILGPVVITLLAGVLVLDDDARIYDFDVHDVAIQIPSPQDPSLNAAFLRLRDVIARIVAVMNWHIDRQAELIASRGAHRFT